MQAGTLFAVILTLTVASLPASAAPAESRALYAKLCVEHGAEKAITDGAMKYGANVAEICRHDAEDAFPEPAGPAQCQPLPPAGLQAMCQQMLGETGKAAAFCPGFVAERVHDSTLLSGEATPGCPGSFYLVLTDACIRLADERAGGPQEDGVCVFTAQGDRPLLAPLQSKDSVNTGSLQRMRAHLPSGTPVAEMVAELTAAGFKCSVDGVEGMCKGSQTVLGFTRRRFSGFGSLDWTLRWTADPGGRLERLNLSLFPMHL